jgi:hypothetical protein
MKGSAADRLIILLAASGLSDHAIHEALRFVERSGSNTFLKYIREARQHLDEYSGVYSSELPSFITGSNVDQPTGTVAVDQAVQLLLTEARLPPAVAAAELTKSLLSTRGNLRDLPRFKGKEGLRKWLGRLPVSPTELLRHAVRIRNEFIHSPREAWPLRDRGE